MPLTAVAGGALFAHRHGSAQPRVLALHGWRRSGSDFHQVLAGLDALAVDLPGFGATPPPREAEGAAGYARMVAPVLEEMETPALVVGHSFGGRVAVELAVSHPQRVAGLVLTGVPLLRLRPPRRPPLSYRLLRTGRRWGLVSERRMDAARSRFGSADYRAAEGVMRQVLVRVVNESYRPQLEALAAPVRLVWGELDREVPPTVAEAAMAVLTGAGKDAELLVLPGVGHMTPVEAPVALRNAIDGLLR